MQILLQFSRATTLSLMLMLTMSCQADQKPSSDNNNLWRFAYANCMFLHFKSNEIDTKDIRAISGGIVETGTSSAESYQKIASFIRKYEPNIKTKNDVDPNLIKCFYLDESNELKKLIGSLK